MKLLKFSEKTIISTIRYLAHLFSVLLIFVVVLLALGEGFPSPSDLTSSGLMLTLSLLVMLAGLLSSWKWEGIGGTLIILGFLLFFIINSVSSGSLRLGFFRR